MYYRCKEDGSILDFSEGKYAEDCLYTELEIVRCVRNGKHYVSGTEPQGEVVETQAFLRSKEERKKAVASVKVVVDGMTFDGDEVAQSRMARAITAAETAGMTETVWVLADNTVAKVTKAQLQQALAKAMLAMGELWTVPYQEPKA